jgi:hypothetical protein
MAVTHRSVHGALQRGVVVEDLSVGRTLAELGVHVVHRPRRHWAVLRVAGARELYDAGSTRLRYKQALMGTSHLTSNARRVTQPRSPSLVQIAWQVRTKGVLQFFMDQWRAQGDLPHLRMGRQKLVFIIHPDHVRHVLVTGRQGFDKLQTWESSRQLLLGDGLIASTGELWKRQRRLMSTFFTPRSIEQYYLIMLAEAETTAQRWTSFAESGRPIDMLDEMMRVTACIILRSMFGMDVRKGRLRSLEGDVEDMIRFVNNRETLPLKPPLWVPLPSHRRYQEARARVHAPHSRGDCAAPSRAASELAQRSPEQADVGARRRNGRDDDRHARA